MYIPQITAEDSGVYECYTPDGSFKRVHLIARTESDFEAILNERSEPQDQSDQDQFDFDVNRISGRKCSS